MTSAEELAQQYASGKIDEDKVAKTGGKRNKAEQVEHKHPHPEGDTRKIVATAIRGEEKRREYNLHHQASKKHENGENEWRKESKND